MQILKSKSIGLVLRPFAQKVSSVGDIVLQTLDTIERAHALKVDGEYVFSRIDAVVALDSRFPDHDCGETAGRLKDALTSHHSRPITFVTAVMVGDLFGGVIRQAFFQQIQAGMDCSMCLSSGVRSYLTPWNMKLMLRALEDGARATGLALNEFVHSIMEGRLLDTCDIWHLESWMRAGGHSVRGDQPMFKDRIGWVHGGAGSDGIDGEWHYETAGVEEMPPLINMVKLFGPCIAPVAPVDGGSWKIPDDPKIREREERKFRTKLERQVRAAALEGVNLDFLKNGVMPAYRDWEQ